MFGVPYNSRTVSQPGLGSIWAITRLGGLIMAFSWFAGSTGRHLATGSAAAAAEPLPPELLSFEKLQPHPALPDPLLSFQGKPIRTWNEWETDRKPELKQLFQHFMYGAYPTVKPNLQATITHEDQDAFGGRAILREVALVVAPQSPAVYWLVVLPKVSTGRVPMFVGLNFYGNHTLTDDAKVRIPPGWMYPKAPGVSQGRATEAGRGAQKDAWPIDAILAQGCGLAVAYNGDIRPDDPRERGGLSDLLLPLNANPADSAATATIMAWAWGLLRGVDYLTTLPEVDPSRFAVVGHSRLGKTALLAGAWDDRIRVTIANQAGCGGSAPSRSTNPKGEPVSRINKSFPHWFNGNFKKFNDATDRLPFDQHALVALCAPRAVLFTTASEDQWADPPGQFRVLQAADPVYRLAGVSGFGVEAFPADETLVGDRLGFWNRPGAHAMTRADWATYLKFASRHWAR